MDRRRGAVAHDAAHRLAETEDDRAHGGQGDKRGQALPARAES
jgi:hypothetical protein